MSTKEKPSITDLVTLGFVTSAKISPNGDKIAFVQAKPHWNKNQYERLCYIHQIKEEKTYQLTRSGSVFQMEWINNDSLAILKHSSTDKESGNQIYVFDSLVGEPWKVTNHEKGIQNFKIFAQGLLYLARDPERQEKKKRKDKFGSYVYFEHEKSASALYYVDLEKILIYQKEMKNKTENEIKALVKPIIEISKLLDEPLSIMTYIPSKQNDAIYLNCKIRDDLVHFTETSNYRISINPKKAMKSYLTKEKDKKEKKKEDKENEKKEKEDLSYLGEIQKIAFPKETIISEVSPNGKKLLLSMKERDNLFYTQGDYWIFDLVKWNDLIDSEEIAEKFRKITGDLDRNPYSGKWVKDGIVLAYADGTKTKIAIVSETGKITELDLEGHINRLYSEFDVTQSGYLCFFASTANKLTELYITRKPIKETNLEIKQITNFNDEVKTWDFGTIETIRWKSKDGTEIEGVLRKPSNYDSQKKYPLAFIIHGGPQSFDPESLLEYSEILYYPSVQFVNKDILTLKVNYRGSIGRGQAFLELNKDNLGVGDLWDIESAIDYLDKKGMIDTSKVGCMGWSQGGYISAFVGIHSKRFTAVSVGAGIADWYTYHISNDIPMFTTHYLSGSPFRDRELYEKTAPISKIKEAQTPMLIQHGEVDQRVPITNAKELYRGLKEMNIHVELFIYPGMGHPITKPRENRAIMHQNLNWFSHYLLGEELDLMDEKSKEEKED
ncbi:MAG: S9 family peptidase [Candidatus Heimdallarchaeota archaeon]|nr:S9 family peptidase [Candidatus Heimdallarchaeota archaeon]MBY8994373.1 S9 family peptidase [Candidatus Heimdallarchaeota archaeon]